MSTRPTTPSKVLGRYRLERQLAQGGMSSVWLARRSGSKERFAVKLASGPEGERAQREGEILERFHHTHVVSLVEQGAHEGGWALVMEYVEAPSLAKVLKADPPSLERSLEWMVQLCGALQHCHERGVVHRDVKANNVLMTRDVRGRDRLVLLDFGVGLVQGDERTSGEELVLGSVHTMSPEQVSGAEIGPRTDLYSVGVLLYRLVTQQYPFHSPNKAQVLAQHLHRPPPPFAERGAFTVPEGLEAVVTRCLAKDPADRFSSAEALGQALKELGASPRSSWVQVGVRSPAQEARVAAPRGASWRPPLGVVLIVLSLILAVAALLWRTL